MTNIIERVAQAIEEKMFDGDEPIEPALHRIYLDVASVAIRPLQDRCDELEAAMREIRRVVTAPRTNEWAIGIVHEIASRALSLSRPERQ